MTLWDALRRALGDAPVSRVPRAGVCPSCLSEAAADRNPVTGRCLACEVDEAVDDRHRYGTESPVHGAAPM